MIERMYTKMRTEMNMRSGKVLGWVFLMVDCATAQCMGMGRDASGGSPLRGCFNGRRMKAAEATRPYSQSLG